MFMKKKVWIAIDTKDFKEMSVSELRKFTLNYYKTYLKGKKISIKNALNEVHFYSGGGRKLAYGEAMYSQKTAVIEHLEELIKNSTYNNWGDRKKNDAPNVLGYMNFKSNLIIDQQKKHIRISLIITEDRKVVFKNFEVGTKK